MSATDQMRAMLDQLMGSSRNGSETKSQKLCYSDNRVCKSFLLDCCPHDILQSTRMDLGECPKVHDLALRADYEQASKERELGYELDALDHLESFVNDADRKTEAAKKRLAETQEELSAEAATKLNLVHELAEEIGKKLAAAEKLGADGLVEESMKMMEEVENSKKEKMAAELDYRSSMPASSYQQQKLRVCEVCSAYLGIHDNDRRLADHFGGKLHLGFITIREKLEELKVRCPEVDFFLTVFQTLVEEKKQKGCFDRIERGGNDRRQDRRRSPGRFDRRGDDRRRHNDTRRDRGDERDRYSRDTGRGDGRRDDRYRRRSRSPDRNNDRRREARY